MGNFIVSARKYRPTRFEDIVGQSHVWQTLVNALEQDHLGHSFLFTGPRGVGKTTCARILARVLNCQHVGKTYEACGQCSSCEAFEGGASFNILELDAASHNSVDHIRQLVEQVRIPPQSGSYKVFIIDEVHMLSTSAFNAFLKTLEEPPPYAVFILATTEKHKILPTILSRVQIFDFRRIQIVDIIEHLQGICELEGIEASEEALHIIAQKADGALRDALSIFDRVVSFSGKKLEYQTVIENLNVLDYEYYFEIADSMLMENVSGLMLKFDEVVRRGFDLDLFLAGFEGHLRNIMVAKNETTLSLLEVGTELKKRYEIQSGLVPLSLILSGLDILNQASVNYKLAIDKRLHVEMALIKCAYIQRLQSATLKGDQGFDPKKKIEPVITPLDKFAAETEVLLVSNSEAKSAFNTEAVSNEKSADYSKMNKTVRGGFTLDLSKIEAEVASENAEKEKQEALLVEEVDLPIIQMAWDNYKDAVKSDSQKQHMAVAELSVVDPLNFKIIVGTNHAKNTLVNDTNLLLFLRNKCKAPRLKYTIEVDTSKAPKPMPKPKHLYSGKETFQDMADQNPLILKLVKDLDLRIDE